MLHFYHFHPDEKTFPGYGKQGAKFGVISTVRGTRSAETSVMPIGQASINIFKEYQDTNEIYFTNLIKEPHAFGKKPYAKYIKQYLPTLMEELKYIFGFQAESWESPPLASRPKPSRILVMGAVLAKHLCPGFKDLNQDRGSFFYNPSLHAYVVPTYHFGSVVHSPRMKEWMKRDLDRFFTLSDPVAPEYQALSLHNLDHELWLPTTDPALFLDIETESVTDDPKGALNVESAKIISIGIKTPYSDVFIIENPTKEDLATLHQKILNHNKIVIGHNLSFDLAMLSWREGKLWDDVEVVDTMLMSYVLGHTNKALKHLTTFLTDRPGSRAFGGVTNLTYLTEDVLSTEAIYNYFLPKMEGIFAYPLLNKLVPKFVGMRQTGVAIDNDLFKDVVPILEKEVSGLLDALQKRYAFGQEINWNSPKQVSERLLAEGVPLRDRTPTGVLSVSAPILESLRGGFPVVEELLIYRDKTKTLAFLHSYNDFMQYDGRLHPRLMLDGAETGRLSCRDPNLQQVPVKGLIKKLFISQFPGGQIGLVDLAQAELRVAALLSGDEKFIEALNSQDVHRYIASLVYGIPADEISSDQRSRAKTIAFGLLYGGGVSGLAGRLGVNPREVQQVVDIFFNQFPTLMAWIDYLKAKGVRYAQSETLFGRIRDYRDALRFEGVAAVERKAINSPVQGTASDVMLIIMVKLYELCVANKLRSRPILGIHDSTLIDIHPDEWPEIALYVGEAFKEVNHSPLGELPLWNSLPIEGELSIGQTWAHVESSSEFFSPLKMFKISSHVPVKEIAVSHYTI